MTFLRVLSIFGLSVGVGIIIWLAISCFFYFAFKDANTWPPLNAPLSYHIKAGLMAGVAHGVVAAIGLLSALPKGSVGTGLVRALIVTEIGLAIFQTWYFSFVFFNWKGANWIETVLGFVVYFLVFSAILFVPTILIAFIVGKLSFQAHALD